MSEELERLARKIENGVGRRGFLGRLSVAAVALVASVFGFARRSDAVPACGCCNLCLPASAGCTGICSWSWFCRPEGQYIARCYEFYSSGTCNGSCSGVSCSFCSLHPLISG